MVPPIVNLKRWSSSAFLGLLLGTGFGLWDLVWTRLYPLADDTPLTILAFYGPMFAVWAVASFAAARRTGKLLDGVKTGAVVAFATFCALVLLVIVRVNLLLGELSARADWQSLLERFRTSGFENLRTYANYEYLTGAPFKILTASIIGACTGVIGGVLGRMSLWPLTSRRWR